MVKYLYFIVENLYSLYSNIGDIINSLLLVLKYKIQTNLNIFILKLTYNELKFLQMVQHYNPIILHCMVHLNEVWNM